MASNNLSDCARARALIGPDVGPRKSTTESLEAYQHVESCESCQRFFEQQQGVVDRVGQIAATIQTPAHLRDRVIAAIDREGSIEPIHSKRWTPAIGVFVAAAAAFAIWIGVRPPSTSTDFAAPTVAAAIRSASTSDSMETTESLPLQEWFQSHSVPSFEIPVIEEAQLIGGRVIQVGGQIGAAVEFIKDGRRLTYVMAPVSAWRNQLAARDIMAVSSDGYEVAMWEEDGSARAVLSSMPRRDLLTIAEQCKYKSIL